MLEEIRHADILLHAVQRDRQRQRTARMERLQRGGQRFRRGAVGRVVGGRGAPQVAHGGEALPVEREEVDGDAGLETGAVFHRQLNAPEAEGFKRRVERAARAVRERAGDKAPARGYEVVQPQRNADAALAVAHRAVQRLEQPAGVRVALRHMREHAEARRSVVLPRRETAAEVAAERIGVRLGKGEVFVHEAAQRSGNVLGIVQVAGEIFRPLEAAALQKPRGIVEVVQFELHTDPRGAQRFQLLAVARELGLVEFLLARLHARPVDAHAVRRHAYPAQQRGILPPVPRVLRGKRGRGVIADIAKPPPVDPAALQLAALALRRGRGHAEQHSVLERKTVHRAFLLFVSGGFIIKDGARRVNGKDRPMGRSALRSRRAAA